MTSIKQEFEFTARNKVLRAAFPNCFSLRLRDYNPTAYASAMRNFIPIFPKAAPFYRRVGIKR